MIYCRARLPRPHSPVSLYCNPLHSAQLSLLLTDLLQKDLELERKVMQWMVNILKERPESPSMFERWIQDGKKSSDWKK